MKKGEEKSRGREAMNGVGSPGQGWQRQMKMSLSISNGGSRWKRSWKDPLRTARNVKELPVNIVITGILKAPKNINYGFSLGEFGFETLRVLLPTDTNTNVFHFTVIFAIDCKHQGEFEVMDIKSSSHRCPVRVNTRVVHHLTIRYYVQIPYWFAWQLCLRHLSLKLASN